MSSTDRCVMLFASIHDVMAAEKSLRTHGMWCDTVPTPRELSTDCGMAIELKAGDLPALQHLGATALVNCRGIYRRSQNEFEKVQWRARGTSA